MIALISLLITATIAGVTFPKGARPAEEKGMDVVQPAPMAKKNMKFLEDKIEEDPSRPFRGAGWKTEIDDEGANQDLGLKFI